MFGTPVGVAPAVGDGGGWVPRDWHWKVLVASSNGKEYAVGQGVFRYTNHGCTCPVQVVLVSGQDKVATVLLVTGLARGTVRVRG